MIRTGIGFDIHRFARGRPLVLGGVRIESDRGLAGHSDADVICHAAADALLGAMADGDIGSHFPDTDPAWKNADSLGLLRRVAARVRALGGSIGNVDCMVLAEVPRLAPHIPAMRSNMARAMGIAPGRVSVKATTLEGLGALGRRAGIAAQAVATVEVRARSGAAGKRRKTPALA
ncbi:MAG: 2-C-methyl-D-erythritol 2,4-cyclodiphosphate synthase [Lentisphaerae bacterium]|nr:2-C-methyl-D-erythritol 2,4-cyclodiphosphate synthase [Lentisphaerota bacterium]